MTTPDSAGSGGATTTGSGGLAAGPGDDSGDAALTQEAEEGSPARPDSAQNSSEAPSGSGGLAAGGEEGP
jgi:hypothetical protein